MSEVSVTNVPVPMVPVEVVVREPFDTLYHREFAGLVRLAMVLVDSQEQAEEVVQDAFAALYLRYRLVVDAAALCACIGVERQPQGAAAQVADASPAD